jgi:RNA polymerase sigma-70 factor (ECF subfamily)
MHTPRARDRSTDVSEIELLGRIKAGDRAAFVALMRRHNQKLYRTARSVLRDDAEAEDAVQEAWMIAYRSLSGFRGDAKLSTWLVRIVVNESIGRLRRHKRDAEVIRLGHGDDRDDEPLETTMDDTRVVQTEAQPEGMALRGEMRKLLEAKIDLLPETFRTVFMLRAVEEMTVDETAAALGIPEATVRTRFFRAKGLLREALARDLDLAVGDAFAFAGARCDCIVERVLARLGGAPADA